eukprot:1037598-Prymnesium_polylepis.1
MTRRAAAGARGGGRQGVSRRQELAAQAQGEERPARLDANDDGQQRPKHDLRRVTSGEARDLNRMHDARLLALRHC